MPTLSFVHRRGQQGRDPDMWRRRWAAALNKGLTAAGRNALDPAAIEAIRFPYYGDVLWAAVVQGRAAVPDVAALDAVQRVDPGLPDPVNRRQVAVLQSMVHELGQASPASAALLAVPDSMLVRGLLEWVANHSGVDEAVIRGFLRDVSAYLDLPGCRADVQAVVRPALLAADAHGVLVGHSLGGVVCAELLAEDQVRERVGLFVAVGAPLGL